MNRGRVVTVLDHDQATKERIMTAAAGSTTAGTDGASPMNASPTNGAGQ